MNKADWEYCIKPCLFRNINLTWDSYNNPNFSVTELWDLFVPITHHGVLNQIVPWYMSEHSGIWYLTWRYWQTNISSLSIHKERKWITGRGHRGISHIRAFAGFGSAQIDTNPDPFSPQQANLTFHWISFNWTAWGRVWETTAGRKRDMRYWRQLWERTLVTVIRIYLHYQSQFVLVKKTFWRYTNT